MQCLVIVNGKIWSFTAVFHVLLVALLCYGPGVAIVIVPRGTVLVMYVM